jgi:hypothetical protein
MTRTLSVLALAVVVPLAASEERKPFPPGKHGGGELAYVQGVPVLVVRGSAADMGAQFGRLAVRNAPDLTGLHERFLKDTGQEKRYPLVLGMCGLLRPNFPPHHAAELEAAAKASGREEGFLLFANTVADISSGMGCSTVVVEKARSASGGTIFGRNFDWFPTRGIHDHTLVVVYKGDGKRAFAAVTVSPIMGVISGMNDAGLCVTMNEIHLRQSKDKSGFNWKGTPLVLAFRRVLEECATVSEAEKLLRGMPRTTSACMTVCDANGGAVFEMTPANLAVRRAPEGVTCCTNHFRSDSLCTNLRCWRYAKLSPLEEAGGKLGVADVFARLDDVHQGKATLQSMVFEPADRVLHLAYGDGPATKRTPVKLELGKLFEGK